MFLTQFSVKRPIAMSCLIIALVLLGLNSYRNIGVDMMPSVEIPFVSISAVYPGASPEEIEIEVTKRIEDAVASIDGLKTITSTSMENVAIISLEFNLGVNVDTAATDVREKLDPIMDDFPAEVESPVLKKIDTNAISVVDLMLLGNTSLDELYDYADDKLSDMFATLPGVGEVQVAGGDELQLHIITNKEKMQSADLTIEDLVNNLAVNNVKIPAGRMKSDTQEINVSYDAKFRSIGELENLEVGKHNGKRIYLRDVATIKLMSKEPRTAAFIDGKPAISLKIIKKGDANAVKLVEMVREKFEELNKPGNMPRGMHLEWFKDTGAFIQSSVDDAQVSIFIGIILTALLLFLFLHEPRSTFIVIISMPVSIAITFAIMSLMNYTFNMMTLLSLGTSVGVLVTNSIVVIENIFNKFDLGKNNTDAAYEGTNEVIAPVAASALTNVVVFVPIATMSSLVGRFMAPFAMVMVVATIVSLFVSFTLTPILAMTLLKNEKRAPNFLDRTFFKLWDKGYDYISMQFSRSIVWTRRYAALVILGTVAVSFLIITLVMPRVGSDFFPNNDRGQFSIKIEYPSDYNLETAIKRTLALSERLRTKFKGIVLHTSSVIGKVAGRTGQVTEGVYLAEINVITTQKDEREADLDALQEMFRAELADLENCITTQSIPSDVGAGGAEIQALIAGPDLQVLETMGTAAKNTVEKTGLVTDVDSSVRPRKKMISILPKRGVLKDLGLNAKSMGSMVRGAFEGLEVGTYRIGARSFDVRIKNEEEKGLDQVENLTLSAIDGKPLNINVSSEILPETVSVSINRSDKERVAWLYGNPAPGVALGEAIKAMDTDISAELPDGYKLKFSGTVEKMQEAQEQFIEAFLIASILTFLLIAAIMESWSKPFLIMFTIPLGFMGLFLGLYIMQMPLSMMGLLGAVMLIGIVVNNAILISDEAGVLTAKGMGSHEAMLKATDNKFRPIVMTSIASVAGMLPMAFGSGLGSETRSSCGVAVVGGLVFSTVMTLYVIPALFFLFTKDSGNPDQTFWRRLCCLALPEKPVADTAKKQ